MIRDRGSALGAGAPPLPPPHLDLAGRRPASAASPRALPASLLAAALLLTGCQATTGAPETADNENRNLHGLAEAQQRRLDEIAAEKKDLERRVKELEAQVANLGSAEKVVEEAKEEISATVRQMMERFRGDSDIDVERTPEGYSFVLRQAVLFESGSDKLTAPGRAVLMRVADALRGGEHPIRIEGHTDDVPVAKPETMQKFPRGNMELSVARSLAVWEALVKEGRVAEPRLSVTGFGPHRPRVPNDSERNQWRNRRVEIHVAEN